MSRQLLILRHGKSDPVAEAAADFERPLAKRGFRDAPRIGHWMKKHDLTPDLILSSPALRARQTVEAVADELGVGRDQIRFDDRLYLASCDTLKQVLQESTENIHRILIVGHNPGLEELLESLADEPPPRNKKGKLLTTAALGVLETDLTWQAMPGGQSRLRRIVYPRDLKQRK